jgi:hypothetical protein
MKKVVRLTESDLSRIVRRVISEQSQSEVAQKLMACSAAARGKSDIEEIAGMINDAINGGLTGLGTDEEAVYDAIMMLGDAEDVCALKNTYKKIFRLDLMQDILDDFSGSELNHVINLLSQKLQKQRKKITTR